MFNISATRYMRDTSYVANRAIKRATKATINRKLTERGSK